MTKEQRAQLLADLDDLERDGWEVEMSMRAVRGRICISQIRDERFIAYDYDNDGHNIGGDHKTLTDAARSANLYRPGTATAGPTNIDADGREVA